MGRPASQHPQRSRWPLALAMLLIATVAAAAPLPTAPQVGFKPAVAAEGTAGPAVATDPLPPPGAVLAAGPTVVGARVTGVSQPSVQFLVDGIRTGPFVDPDGQLSGRRGAEATLAPGIHRLAVATPDQGLVREWDVTASGLAIDPAGTDPAELAIRMSGRRAGPRPILLVDPDHPGTALAAAPLAATLDALVLPAGQNDLPAGSRQALAEVDDPAEQPVLVLGGPDGVGEVVTASLADLGYPVTRLGTGGPAQVAAGAAAHQQAHLRVVAEQGGPDAGMAVVVAPADPTTTALRGAATAAAVGAALVLVEASGPPVEATEVLAAADTVLLATELTDTQRAGVAAMLPEGVAVSQDTLDPRRANEAVVVLDGAPEAAALVATRAADPNRAVVLGTAAGRAWVAEHRPERVTLVGPAPEAAAIAPLLHLDWVDGPDAPRVEALVDPADPLTVTFTADAPIIEAQVHVDLLGFEWPGALTVEGDRAIWRGEQRPRLPEALEPPAAGTDGQIDVTAVLRTDGGTRHLRATSTASITPLPSLSEEAFLVAGGSSRVVGTGPLRTFSVEVEPLTNLDLDEVAEEITEILLDPRGWTADGSRSLQRIGSSQAADLRVVVARPVTVDRLCGAVGLSTGGRVSCWDGYRAMLNLDRWNTGVVPFHADIEVYRQYLVNHELGHGLGYGHVFCPGPGALAPVMMQQTGGLGFCTANGWPYPDAGTIPAVEG